MDENLKNPYDILFIDDEEALRSNYVQYLKRYFRNVYEAGDGETAYKIYQEKRPQIMLVDINIPRLNGIDLMKKIRKTDHSVKAIMLTAHSNNSYLLQAIELKLTKYLLKPISRKELNSGLDLVLQELSQFDISPKKIVVLKENFIWNYDMQELLHFNNSVLLTNKERKILVLLFSAPKSIFSYDEIILDVWYDYDEDKINALKTIIKNLRKKLPKDTIKNIFGIGYKIEI
ncbi:response regulator transcription factor [bacterium]|nr:response regulator transcription factor [bacterium]MBU1990739.1 response regulator transcription factor [bacterium]